MTDNEMKANNLTAILFPELIKSSHIIIDFNESVESIIPKACEEYERLYAAVLNKLED